MSEVKTTPRLQAWNKKQIENRAKAAEQRMVKQVGEGIGAVLSGRIKHFESPLGNPTMAEKYLKPLGWEMGELETNGWQYDWWINFSKDGKTFTASGSGYYGGFEFQEDQP